MTGAELAAREEAAERAVWDVVVALDSACEAVQGTTWEVPGVGIGGIHFRPLANAMRAFADSVDLLIGLRAGVNDA